MLYLNIGAYITLASRRSHFLWLYYVEADLYLPKNKRLPWQSSLDTYMLHNVHIYMLYILYMHMYTHTCHISMYTDTFYCCATDA